MKATKKILSVLLVMVMLVALSATAFAADTGNITVNINPAFTKAVPVNFYRILDATSSGTGTNAKIGYTANSAWETWLTSTAASAWVSTTAGTNSSPVKIGSDMYYITLTEATAPAFATAALKYALENSVSPDLTETAAAGAASVALNNVPLGYYLIHPEGGVEQRATGTSLASLKTNNDTVAVNIKSEPIGGSDDGPGVIDKKADGQSEKSVNVGDVVPFTVTGTIPDATGYSSYTYILSDTMTGLEMTTQQQGQLRVTVGGTDVTNSVRPTKTSTSWTADLSSQVTAANKGKPVVITYSATVTSAAITNPASNDVDLVYSNNPADPTSTGTYDPGTGDDPSTTLYTNTVTVEKVDGNNAALAGAEFVLKNAQGQYYQQTPATGTPTKVTWVANEAQATKLLTVVSGTGANAKATVSFQGIEDGTYQLVETKAPDGFTALTDPIDVNSGNAIDSVTAQANQTVTETVQNYSGAVLPGTGGIGTTIFYVLGACLLLGAAVLLITRRRMSSEG